MSPHTIGRSFAGAPRNSSPVTPLPPGCPPALESHAQRIAAQLLAHEHVGTRDSPASRGRDLQHVDVDSLELIRPRSVGIEHVGLWAMDQLGLRTLFDEVGLGVSIGAAVGSIIARMARPGSERAARCWLGERSALSELLGVESATTGPMRLYRASDALMAQRDHRAPSVRPGHGTVRPVPHRHAPEGIEGDCPVPPNRCCSMRHPTRIGRGNCSSSASNVAPHGHDSMQFNALTDHGCGVEGSRFPDDSVESSLYWNARFT